MVCRALFPAYHGSFISRQVLLDRRHLKICFDGSFEFCSELLEEDIFQMPASALVNNLLFLSLSGAGGDWSCNWAGRQSCGAGPRESAAAGAVFPLMARC
jgi:hypothetical protein